MTLTRADVARVFDVSERTMARLDTLVTLVGKWQRAINLVAPATLPAIWHRHVADSAQLLAHAPTDARSWADLGAGAGFPGLVVAALATDHRPDLRVTLVESDTRKAVFLTEAVREMTLDVIVHATRVADLPAAARFDVVSARALAPLADLLPMARPLLTEGGAMLFPKGANADAELATLAPIDRDAATRIVSVTDPRASLLLWV
jgi:16S rRNA (guanine527-N7)-methyltransferase